MLWAKVLVMTALVAMILRVRKAKKTRLVTKTAFCVVGPE